MTENAGCAACLGGPVDTFGRINKSGHQLHQRHEPEFPRPHGRQGIKGVPRLARDGGRERDCRQDRCRQINREGRAFAGLRVDSAARRCLP
jgi:hypothetical protein